MFLIVASFSLRGGWGVKLYENERCEVILRKRKGFSSVEIMMVTKRALNKDPYSQMLYNHEDEIPL